MKIWRAASMVEGAPFGNKNAAGKHGGGGQRKVGLLYVGSLSGGKKHVIFSRGQSNRPNSPPMTAKGYRVSPKRAAQAVAVAKSMKGKRGGAAFRSVKSWQSGNKAYGRRSFGF